MDILSDVAEETTLPNSGEGGDLIVFCDLLPTWLSSIPLALSPSQIPSFPRAASDIKRQKKLLSQRANPPLLSCGTLFPSSSLL